MQDFLFYYLLGAGILGALILTVAIIVILCRQKNERSETVTVAQNHPKTEKEEKQKSKGGKGTAIRYSLPEKKDAEKLFFSAVIWGLAVPTVFLSIFHMISDGKDTKPKHPKKRKQKKSKCKEKCKCCSSKCPFRPLGCKGRFAKP